MHWITVEVFDGGTTPAAGWADAWRDRLVEAAVTGGAVFWDDAVERSRGRLAEALAEGGLDQLVHLSTDDGRQPSLRRLLCDLIEEYGRHTGHADLLREAVDGLVGEDPPAGWRATTGR